MKTQLHPSCLFLVLAAMLLAPVLSGQVNATGPYHDMQYRFLAQPPLGTRVYYTAVSGSDVGFEAHRDEDVFYVHAEPAPATDLAGFMERQKTEAQKMCSDKAQFTQEDMQVGGTAGMQLRAECSSNDPDTMSPRRVLVVQMTMRDVEDQGQVVYTLGMLTTPKSESKARDGYLSMADSFKLL